MAKPKWLTELIGKYRNSKETEAAHRSLQRRGTAALATSLASLALGLGGGMALHNPHLFLGGLVGSLASSQYYVSAADTAFRTGFASRYLKAMEGFLAGVPKYTSLKITEYRKYEDGLEARCEPKGAV